jgi:BNR repeat-like domain
MRGAAVRPKLILTLSVVVLAATQLSVVQASAAPAGSSTDQPVGVVSGPTPFAGGCPGRRQDSAAVPGSEVEPSITVDPSDSRSMVTTWQQDVGGFSSRSDLIGWSPDGGRSWNRATIPGLTVCTGGTADFASDSWLSTGVDGTVYFSAATGTATATTPPISIVISRSRDGGRTWPAPTTVAEARIGNDSDSVTASPTLAGHAYLVWANWDHTYQPPMANTLSFSRTTDRGAHWSPAVTLHTPDPTAVDFSGHVLVLPNGGLLAVWANFDVATNRGALMASRSQDDGRTWQPAVVIGSHPVGSFVDPETGIELPQPGFPSAAVSPNGTVYIASEASTSPTDGAITVARSTDGGRTWTSRNLPGVTAFAFEPAVAVDGRGTVGVIWYDLRSDVPGGGGITTDVWFARSTDRGTHWRQTHLAGPFDLASAAIHWVGEYQGMAGLTRGFASVFTMAAPRAVNGPNDIFVGLTR